MHPREKTPEEIQAELEAAAHAFAPVIQIGETRQQRRAKERAEIKAARLQLGANRARAHAGVVGVRSMREQLDDERRANARMSRILAWVTAATETGVITIPLDVLNGPLPDTEFETVEIDGAWHLRMRSK